MAIQSQRRIAMAAQPQTVKQYLHRLADELPEGATIEEALYHLVLRLEIEAGLADSDAGRTTPVEELLAQRGIAE
jgi:predicted transcriptional regulator